MSFTNLATAIVAGLGIGGVYVLIGLSFTLIIASTKFFVFVIESLVALGGILAFVFATDLGLPMAVVLVMTVVVGGVGGVLLYWVLYRTLRNRAHPPDTAVLLCGIGLAIAADAFMGLIFGTDPRQVQPYVSQSPIVLHGVPIQPSYLVMLGIGVVIVGLLEVVFHFTSIGKQLLASQEDPEGASLVGIDVPRIALIVFAGAGVLACLSGLLISPVSLASPTTGQDLIVPTFTALAIGGFGSPRGAIAGGFIVGLVTSIVPLYAPQAAVNPILFAIMIVFLMVRPMGLFQSVTVRQF